MKSIGVPIGISAAFWLCIGMLRVFLEIFFPMKKSFPNKFINKDIAVIIAAHNEELVIKEAIRALKQSLHQKNIYVVSDGSTDKTYTIAKNEGVHISNLQPGRGKGKGLVYMLKKFKLFSRYKLIFIVDADTRIDPKFIPAALPYFNDPEISVVFGAANVNWPRHILPRLGLYFVSYRERLNQILRLLYGMGQTWKYTNVSYVIPGFAALYRSKVLKKLSIDKEGLLIEDFNLAFELQRKKLGKVGFDPSLVAWDQHPDSLEDYWKQVRRWNIGFFQTIKLNGIWPSFFWLALGIFTVEVFFSSILILLLPSTLLLLIMIWLTTPNPSFDTILNSYIDLGPFQKWSLFYVLWLLAFDYTITILFAISGRKPQLLFYGLFFLFMHFVTSLILISSIIPGFFGSSVGRWTSPKRRAEIT